MGFAVRHLSVLAYANGFTLWHYKAADLPLAEASAPDFFATASDLLGAGDIVMVSAPDGARVLAVTDQARTAALA